MNLGRDAILEKKSEDDKSDKLNKVFLTQRLFAYFFDTLIVLIVASLLASPFINADKIKDLEDKYYTLIKESSSNKISSSQFNTDIVNVGYDLAVQNGMITIINVIVGVLYFVVLQVKMGGQTLGKKIVKIKVISNEGDLSYNQMIFRSFIANSILLDIITILFLMFSSRSTYFSCVIFFTFIQYLITFSSLIMILYSKRGLAVHDKLVHTRVVRLK